VLILAHQVLEGLSDKQRDLVRGWNFNVSHSGSWTVLAASNSRLIGVDVQKIEISGIDKVLNTGARVVPPVPYQREPWLQDEERFFAQLESVFNRTEWATIRSSHSHRLASFFHFWTLKESYIKVPNDVQMIEHAHRVTRVVRTHRPWESGCTSSSSAYSSRSSVISR